jgi:hypothetical protein
MVMDDSTAIDPNLPSGVLKNLRNFKNHKAMLIPFVVQNSQLIASHRPFDVDAYTKHFLETSAQAAVSKVPAMI